VGVRVEPQFWAVCGRKSVKSFGRFVGVRVGSAKNFILASKL